MSRTHSRLCLAAVAIAASSGVVAYAQDAGPDYFFKMRAQAGFSQDLGLQNAIGIGWGANFKSGAGQFGLELSYHYNPGVIFRAAIPANTLGANQLNSVMTQKLQTNMVGARASYSMPIDAGWSWQAGFGIYGAKARMETIGDFQVGATVDGAWTIVTEKSSLAFQPFGGVSYQFPESASLEFNIVYVTYDTPNVTAAFAPGAGAYNRVTPVLGDKTVSNFRFEFNYVFHF